MTAITPAEAPLVLRRRAVSVPRYLGMPVALGLVCVALYRYVSTRELDNIEARLLNAAVIREGFMEHLALVGVSTLIVVGLTVPLGIVLTRPFARPVSATVLALANIGQVVPSLGVIVLLAILFTVGFRYAVVALVLYAFLPVLRNTMVGLQQVDPALLESGRGMGMTRLTLLRRIELPLAVPVVLAGIRTALTINVGTATIGAFTNAGGLGTIIFSGIVQNRRTVLLTGAVLAAVLALALDHLAGIAEDLLRPRGL